MDGWTQTHSQKVMVENMGLQSLSFIDAYSFLDFWPQVGKKKKKANYKQCWQQAETMSQGREAEWNKAGRGGVRVLEIMSLIRCSREGRMSKLLVQAKPQENC